MVEPYHVEQAAGRAQPLNPPAIAFVCHGVPIVQRIAPELPVRAEIVRRNTRHAERPAIVVELEQRRVFPHVRRVVRHIDGQIADHPNLISER